LIVHCGGPGSTKECVDSRVGGLGPIDTEIADDFNIVGIDQRGIGESEPVLGCRNSRVKLPPIGRTTNLSDFTNCSCEVNDVWFVEFGDDTWQAQQQYFEGLQTRLLECYNSPHLQLEGFNVMDFIGTSHLAHDLNLFRQAIGADKLSVVGVSYGTWVGAVFASTYPQYTDKVVLDSNLPPAATAPEFSRDYAQNEQKVRDEMVTRCRFTGGCTKQLDPDEVFLKSTGALDARMFKAQTDFGDVVVTSGNVTRQMHGLLRDNTHYAYLVPPSRVEGLASYRTYAAILEDIALAADEPEENRTARTIESLNGFCAVRNLNTDIWLDQCVDAQGASLALKVNLTSKRFDCPTWKQYGFCANVGDALEEDYIDAGIGGLLVYTGVMSTDVPSRLLPSQQVQLAQTLVRRYGATGAVAGHIMELITQWPGRPVYPGIGSIQVAPLILGMIDDSATSFKWTQQMKLAFPAGSLMTFQGYFHGMPSPFEILTPEQDVKGILPCLQKTKNYLRTGNLPQNGFACHLKGFYNPNAPNSELVQV